MNVEQNTGTYVGTGIIAQVIGGAVWFSNLGSYDSDGATIIGAMLTLVGAGLLLTGITKVAKNLEVNASASVSAESHLRAAEDHLRVMRNIAIREEGERHASIDSDGQ